MSGLALDSRPTYHDRVLRTLLIQMRHDSSIFRWFKSSKGELYTLAPNFILLLTGAETMGKSKLLLRVAGATSHVEIHLGSDEDKELRELIDKTDPQTMDGDEWACTLFSEMLDSREKAE